MGAAIPVFGIDLMDITAQASFGASVHFELHPIGQAQISSNDYYIDFFMLDIDVSKHHFVRFVTGHTSHHLSDNWYERLQLTSSVRYSRDYLKLLYIYNNGFGDQFYCGADYAYIMTIGQKIKKPWRLQAGGESSLLDLYGIADLYAAIDIKLRQEAGFAATNSFQIGAKMPMRNFQLIRLAYQFRFGLDERGQFFPQHRTLSTFGAYFYL